MVSMALDMLDSVHAEIALISFPYMHKFCSCYF